LHNSIRETWDNGHIGFYLGPASAHYRAYRYLVQETSVIRISDSIILYLAPLVDPGASRFDQLIALTNNICAAAETAPANDSRAQLLEVYLFSVLSSPAIVRYRQRHTSSDGASTKCLSVIASF
jgi:hypothetical protein